RSARFSAGGQYAGRLGSISLIQPRMPPLRFLRREKPAARKSAIALALRTPLLQWTTIGRAASNSPRRLGNSLRGITGDPALRPLAISSGLRTSRISGGSAWPKRVLSSCGVISSGAPLAALGEGSAPRTPQN